MNYFLLTPDIVQNGALLHIIETYGHLITHLGDTLDHQVAQDQYEAKDIHNLHTTDSPNDDLSGSGLLDLKPQGIVLGAYKEVARPTTDRTLPLRQHGAKQSYPTARECLASDRGDASNLRYEPMDHRADLSCGQRSLQRAQRVNHRQSETSYLAMQPITQVKLVLGFHSSPEMMTKHCRNCIRIPNAESTLVGIYPVHRGLSERRLSLKQAASSGPGQEHGSRRSSSACLSLHHNTTTNNTHSDPRSRQAKAFAIAAAKLRKRADKEVAIRRYHYLIWPPI